MKLRLQWKHGENWITLDAENLASLDPDETFRVVGNSTGTGIGITDINISFTGDQWDKSILTDIESLSYWAGYYGTYHRDTFDNNSFYQGVLDRKHNNDPK